MGNIMTKEKPKIAILGGMGPQASAFLVKLLVDMSAKEFGVRDGEDFPEIILDSVPIPDFIEESKNIPAARKLLKDRIKVLDGMDISCFSIACNTAHVLLDDLKSTTNTHFVSIIDSVVKEVDKQRIKKVGILASPMTIKMSLFQSKLDKLGIKFVLPSDNEQKELETIIRIVISGEASSDESKRLKKIVERMRLDGAEGIILGCTELSLVAPKNPAVPVFDSLIILARSLLNRTTP